MADAKNALYVFSVSKNGGGRYIMREYVINAIKKYKIIIHNKIRREDKKKK